MIYQLFGSGLSFVEILALIIAYCLALVIAFSSHEFAHALTAYKMGDPTAKALGRLSLNPFKHIDPIGFLCLIFLGFGWAKPVEINPLKFKHYRRGLVFVSLAGVTANLILAFIFCGIYFFVSPLIVASTNLFLIFIQYFLYFIIVLNLSLFVFNLLPIYPLDGFNFIKAITKEGNAVVRFLQKYGTIILIVFLITPIFEYIYFFVTEGLISIFSSFWGLFI